MRHAWIAAPVLFAALSLPALAAGSGATGSFAYAAGESDNVDKAIEKAIANANIVVRTVARGKLRDTNKPYQHVTIAVSGKSISITTPGRAALTGTSGSPFSWTREDGEKVQVTLKHSGGAIEEVFATGEGKRVNVFTPSADGKKLTMAVTVSSAKLPTPVTYKLVYKRDK